MWRRGPDRRGHRRRGGRGGRREGPIGSGRLANWAISTSFPSLAAAGLVFAYGLYALFAALAPLFVMKTVRETKGRELEEM